MQDLGLRDIARIDGYVVLPRVEHAPHKAIPQLERFVPKTLEEHKYRLRPNDNSDLVPPWEPEVFRSPTIPSLLLAAHEPCPGQHLYRLCTHMAYFVSHVIGMRDLRKSALELERT